ncbi:syndecan-4 [Anolis sagrei]|uniref:syndecan-4 n=1 Tax=Anolis sagrei TaxID=38937 RepID=UPI0035200270
MQPLRFAASLLLALLLVSATTGESVRETETMDPQLYAEEFSSGDLPDDEDSRTDFIIDDEDESSGSGDSEGYSDTENVLRSNTDSSSVFKDNYIPDSKPEIKDKIDPMRDNEIIVPKKAASPGAEDLNNEISLASTANGSILERTEVLAALIAGGAVGLLFAVFLILLLVYRMKKKDEGSYDLGKKPIYKKAPTNEFYA